MRACANEIYISIGIYNCKLVLKLALEFLFLSDCTVWGDKNLRLSFFFTVLFENETSTMAAIETTDPGDNSQFHKMSAKQLRHKAQEFLSSRKYANNLVDIISQWEVSLIYLKYIFFYVRLCFILFILYICVYNLFFSISF